MKHYVIWHDNGDKSRNAKTCGYSEEITEKSLDEIIQDYEKHDCTVFSIDIINNPA